MEKDKIGASQHWGKCSPCNQRWLNAEEVNSIATDAWKHSLVFFLVGKSPSPEQVGHVGIYGPCAPLCVAEAGFESSRACCQCHCWLLPGKPSCSSPGFSTGMDQQITSSESRCLPSHCYSPQDRN